MPTPLLSQNTQTAATVSARTQQMQFENDRKQLAEQQAAAGRAYSGFRGEAQKQLADSESGIVTSSRAQYQSGLDQAKQAFESKYGTAATPNINLSFTNPYTSSGTSVSGQTEAPNAGAENLSGTAVGGITGSNVTAQKQDINATASNYVALGQTPKVVQP